MENLERLVQNMIDEEIIWWDEIRWDSYFQSFLTKKWRPASQATSCDRKEMKNATITIFLITILRWEKGKHKANDRGNTPAPPALSLPIRHAHYGNASTVSQHYSTGLQGSKIVNPRTWNPTRDPWRFGSTVYTVNCVWARSRSITAGPGSV